MKTKSLSWIIASLLVGAVAFAPSPGNAEATNKENPAAERKAPAQRAIPFRGKIAAIDKTAKTVTVGARVFQITSDSKILKGDEPGTLTDGVVGSPVSGSYHEAGGGKLVVKMIRFGAKPATEEQKPKPEVDDAKKKKG